MDAYPTRRCSLSYTYIANTHRAVKVITSLMTVYWRVPNLHQNLKPLPLGHGGQQQQGGGWPIGYRASSSDTRSYSDSRKLRR